MAKTPVSMKIDGYKDREVLMVTYESWWKDSGSRKSS